MQPKALPKSLHTVTALANLALHLSALDTQHTSAHGLVWQAASILGYGLVYDYDAADLDPHGLIGRATTIVVNKLAGC